MITKLKADNLLSTCKPYRPALPVTGIALLLIKERVGYFE
jgi:hypothetical protein